MISFLKRLFRARNNKAQEVRASIHVAPDNTVSTQLKDWTCRKCGAALPRESKDCDTVTCSYCGSVFRIPRMQPRSGGVNINSSGSITINGDIVGGDRIVIVSNSGIDRQ